MDLIGDRASTTDQRYERFAAPAPRTGLGLWKELGGSRREGEVAVRTDGSGHEHDVIAEIHD